MKSVATYLLVTWLTLITGCGTEKERPDYGKYSRAELRYYAYAPPFIPHEIINPECLDCHKDGLVVEGFRALVTPHREWLNCQQCHIRVDEQVRPFRQNAFVGLAEPQKLPRPQPAAPPLIPHGVFMRKDCLGCHGDPSRKEISQTTHPERWNCLQCHVEQNPGITRFQTAISGKDF